MAGRQPLRAILLPAASFAAPAQDAGINHTARSPHAALSGNEFFYTNVLRRYGSDLPMMWLDTLQRWPDTSPSRRKELLAYCCPPNTVRAAEALEFGEVMLNGFKYAIDLPHGGIKESGIGKDCSHYALEDYLIRKRITTRC
jgi:hypothetical protein